MTLRELKKSDKITIEKYISEIQNEYIQHIFKLKFIDCLTWIQIAHKVGGNTPDSLRMIVTRHLKGKRL